MSLPTKNLKDLSLSKAQLKGKLEEVLTFARLALSGKPLISVQDAGNGAVSLTEGYFGNKTHIQGLRFEDLPGAVAHRVISEDAALEAFRFMVKHKIMSPANENASDEEYENQ